LNLESAGWQLCLDFANTLGGRYGATQIDRLASYGDLVAWSLHAAILTAAEAERLLRGADARPAEAAAVLEEARALREAIYDVFSAITLGREVPTGALDALNSHLSTALAKSRVVPSENGFTLGWAEDDASLDPMLWPLARSAADLLTAGDLDRVSECAAEDCAWLFIDTICNHSRRWCDMQDCGNREKARRFYSRKRQAEG